jgi:hypothetical protein
MAHRRAKARRYPFSGEIHHRQGSQHDYCHGAHRRHSHRPNFYEHARHHLSTFQRLLKFRLTFRPLLPCGGRSGGAEATDYQFAKLPMEIIKWIVTSSSDPSKNSLMVKGVLGMGAAYCFSSCLCCAASTSSASRSTATCYRASWIRSPISCTWRFPLWALSRSYGVLAGRSGSISEVPIKRYLRNYPRPKTPRQTLKKPLGREFGGFVVGFINCRLHRFET